MNDYKTPYRRPFDPETSIVGPIVCFAAGALFVLIWMGAV